RSGGVESSAERSLRKIRAPALFSRGDIDRDQSLLLDRKDDGASRKKPDGHPGDLARPDDRARRGVEEMERVVRFDQGALAVRGEGCKSAPARQPMLPEDLGRIELPEAVAGLLGSVRPV